MILPDGRDVPPAVVIVPDLVHRRAAGRRVVARHTLEAAEGVVAALDPANRAVDVLVCLAQVRHGVGDLAAVEGSLRYGRGTIWRNVLTSIVSPMASISIVSPDSQIPPDSQGEISIVSPDSARFCRFCQIPENARGHRQRIGTPFQVK